MVVIKVCDYFLKTNLNAYDASEIIESSIVDSVVENGEDFPFSLDDFIEEFVESNNKFEIIEDSHDWDIEFTPEQVDEIVEQSALDGGDDDEESDDEEESDCEDEEEE